MIVTGKIVAKEYYEYIGKDEETHRQPTGRVVIDTEENAFVQWNRNVRIGMCTIITTYICIVTILLVNYVNYAENTTYEELCSGTILLFYPTFLFVTGAMIYDIEFLMHKEKKGKLFGTLAGGTLIYVYCRLHTVDFYDLHCLTHFICFFTAVYMILWIGAQICKFRAWRFRKNEFAEKVGAKAQEKPSGQFICVADQAMGMAVDKSRQSE